MFFNNDYTKDYFVRRGLEVPKGLYRENGKSPLRACQFCALFRSDSENDYVCVHLRISAKRKMCIAIVVR